jgi:hypothetical protein
LVAVDTEHPPDVPRKRRGRGYHRSGFYALKTTIAQLGPRVIDRRTGWPSRWGIPAPT